MTCTAQGRDGVYYVLKSTKKQAADLPMKDVQKFAYGFLDAIKEEYNIEPQDVNTDHVDVIINTLNEERYIFGKTYKPPLEDRPFAISLLLAQGKLKFVEGECDENGRFKSTHAQGAPHRAFSKETADFFLDSYA
jgi:hypothetical protein